MVIIASTTAAVGGFIESAPRPVSKMHLDLRDEIIPKLSTAFRASQLNGIEGGEFHIHCHAGRAETIAITTVLRTRIAEFFESEEEMVLGIKILENAHPTTAICSSPDVRKEKGLEQLGFEYHERLTVDVVRGYSPSSLDSHTSLYATAYTGAKILDWIGKPITISLAYFSKGENVWWIADSFDSVVSRVDASKFFASCTHQVSKEDLQ